MVTAIEGGRTPTAAYLAYRGNLTKCAMEHIRPASTLERLAMSEWEELLADVINASAGPDDEVQPDGPSEEDDGDGGALVMNNSLMKQTVL